MPEVKLYRIAANIPRSAVKEMLEKYPPAHQNIWCDTITHAYKVDSDFDFPTKAFEAVVYGYSAGDGHDSLLVSIDGQRQRPDGRMYCIVLSTADGVERKTAVDEITEYDRIEERLSFASSWQRRNLYKSTPRQAA